MKNKIILGIIIAIGVGLTYVGLTISWTKPLVGEITNKVTLIDSLTKTQDDYFKENNKYAHIPLTENLDMIYKVDEIIKPNGDVGYIVEIKTLDGIKYIGYGADAEKNTYTVVNIIEPKTASTTP